MKATKAKKQQEDGLNYWESISDVMAALLLVVLLIMMLFILYMTRMPDVDHIDEYFTSDNEGEYINDEDDPDGWGWGIYWHEWDNDHGDGRYNEGGRGEGTGNGRGDGTGDGTGAYFYENEGEGDWEGDQKAAVHVTVYDGGTGLTVKEAGISFRLYSVRTGLKTLYSYYPEHQQYDSFETLPGGSFYLPEKVGLGRYYLAEISVPYGYDLADDVYFDLDESRDWDDPYQINVSIFPCRNVIRVQNKDASTGSDVPYGTYNVIAAADVSTGDGTLRYREGEIIGQIECDETGYGESELLYIGEYLVQQAVPPTYYARADEETPVRLLRQEEDQPQLVNTMSQQRTAYVLQLRDELYENRAIAGAAFDLTLADGTPVAQGLMTDANGNLTLNELSKGTAYVLTQTGTVRYYQPLAEPLSFSVTEDGRINDEAACTETQTNRMIRVAIGVKDVLFGTEISGKNLALYNDRQELIYLWTSSALSEEIDGLQPGRYSLVVNGQTDRMIELNVEDTKEVQSFDQAIWDSASLAVVGAAAVLLLIGLTLLLVLARKHRKKGEA